MSRARPLTWIAAVLATALTGLFALPLIALVGSTDVGDVLQGIEHPLFVPALLLSLRSATLALALMVILGTPLAYWLAQVRTGLAKAVSMLVMLPVVLPPAVIGIGLLQAFGRRGPWGAWLEELGVHVVFSGTAVVLAQLVVAAPFYVQAAAAAFRRLSPDALLVARTLGAGPVALFFRVAVPLSWPGLLTGASLGFARALGEFGATLLFAGNMPGRTQTLPLAIFAALESDVRLSVVFALVLAAVGAALLTVLQLVGRRGGGAMHERP